MSKIIPSIIAGLGAVIGFLYGQACVPIIFTLLIFMTLDIVTGMIKAFFAKNVNSNIGFKGITKKMLILIILLVIHLLEESVLKTGIVLTSSAIFYYIANEGISIIENVIEFIPVPEKVKEIFEQVKSTNDKDEDQE